MSILMPGTEIEYGGETVTVGAVGLTGGERYYWLTYKDGTVAMLPADVVEPIPYTVTDLGKAYRDAMQRGAKLNGGVKAGEGGE